MGCTPICSTEFGHTYGFGCVLRKGHRPTVSVSDPVAVAYVHIKGGGILEFEDVRPDSIGPSAEHPGVIGIEFNSGAVEIAHVPFVEWWHIEYR